MTYFVGAVICSGFLISCIAVPEINKSFVDIFVLSFSISIFKQLVYLYFYTWYQSGEFWVNVKDNREWR